MKTIKRRSLSFALLLALLLCLLCACAPSENLPTIGEETLPTQEPVEPEYFYCPLDHQALGIVGEDAPLEARVLVCSVDNLKSARPQSGLSAADIVYEAPAEGGVSRFLLVFYHGTTDMVGPIRSARPYLVDIAREWGGVFIHCGGSNDALSYLSQNKVHYINELAGAKGFWRDKSRRAPHNLYTSVENIYAYLESRSWPQTQTVDGFLFLEEEETQSGGEQADRIQINYPGAKNTYTYNSETGLYLRETNGTVNTDRNNDAQIQAANIIVQKVSSKVLDSEGRLSINLVGTGEAYFFSQGIVKQGTWKRDDLDSRTKFYDADGSEWRLAPGQTWIQLADGSVTLQYEDTTPPPSETQGEEQTSGSATSE